MNEPTAVQDDHSTKPRTFSSDHIERAMEDAENLVVFSARSGKTIDKKVFNTLLAARTKWDDDDWSNEFALEFWEAFAVLNNLVKPATVDSIRAICLEPKHSGLRGFLQNQYGLSEATRAITRYTLWTLLVLAVVLFFQIYWVVGNSLSVKLTQLIDTENQLTDAIYQANLDHLRLEVLFKLKEEELGAKQETAIFEFYKTADWERETLQLKYDIQRLEEDLEALKIQLERNFGILDMWAFVWDDSIENTEIRNDTIVENISFLERQKTAEEERKTELLTGDFQEEFDANEQELVHLEGELLALEAQLNELVKQEVVQEEGQSVVAEGESDISQDAVQAAIREKITETLAEASEIRTWLEQNKRETRLNEIEFKMENLEAEIAAEKKKHERWKATETVRRLRLSAEFLLDILEIYLLPILYGLLGASVFVLRKIMHGISNATYSPDRSYLLRLALGTLAGLIIGWFAFLLPGQSALSSISPMAMAFLVGYNIEIVFSAMDRGIDYLTKGDKKQKTKGEGGDNGNGQADSETPQPEGAA